MREIVLLVSFPVILWTSCWIANAEASVPSKACNQKYYDALYRKITLEAIKRGLAASTTEVDNEVSRTRLEEIAALRMLCNGQRSTYETNHPLWNRRDFR